MEVIYTGENPKGRKRKNVFPFLTCNIPNIHILNIMYPSSSFIYQYLANLHSTISIPLYFLRYFKNKFQSAYYFTYMFFSVQSQFIRKNICVYVHVYIYLCIYINVSVCVCVCVCVCLQKPANLPGYHREEATEKTQNKNIYKIKKHT